MERPEETCGTCCFWEAISNGFGHCHRYPPHPKHYFTEPSSDDWCGEYHPNDDTYEKIVQHAVVDIKTARGNN